MNDQEESNQSLDGHSESLEKSRAGHSEDQYSIPDMQNNELATSQVNDEHERSTILEQSSLVEPESIPPLLSVGEDNAGATQDLYARGPDNLEPEVLQNYFNNNISEFNVACSIEPKHHELLRTTRDVNSGLTLAQQQSDSATFESYPKQEVTSKIDCNLPEAFHSRETLQPEALLADGCHFIDFPATKRNTSDTSVQTTESTNNETSSNSICRICQLTRKESDEPLQMTACECKGATGRIHRSCLREWIQYKGSSRCEICRKEFTDITPVASRSDTSSTELNQDTRRLHRLEMMENVLMHLRATRPFNNRKRVGMASTIVFLALCTAMTAVMSVRADREMKIISRKSTATQTDIDETSLIFSICVAFAFFFATLTIGLGLIWATVECFYAIHRRQILRRTGNRLGLHAFT